PLPFPDWCFVLVEDFRRQMGYLARHCRVLRLVEAAAQLRADGLGGDKPAVAITFYDGYQNNFEIAFPVLREFDLPATIFLNTAFIGTDQTLWFCRLNRALAETKQKSMVWQGENYNLDSNSAKSATSARMQEKLKYLAHQQLLDEVAKVITVL